MDVSGVDYEGCLVLVVEAQKAWMFALSVFEKPIRFDGERRRRRRFEYPFIGVGTALYRAWPMTMALSK